MAQPLVLLSADEQQLRLSRLTSLMKQAKADAMLITDNANLYYLTGRVYAGLMFITADGRVTYFVRRPIELTGDNVIYIRKPEQMTEHISFGTGSLAMELDITDYTAIERLKAIFPSATMTNASPVIRKARSVKTAEELRLIGLSGIKQERVYRRIPHLYQDGMTDLELQVEIERVSRLEGCLGQFRISGNSMELYMANILTGENADIPTPYDFAMGGAGLDPSIPVGANGSIIRQGTAVMADVNGNYTGYMTDMTRTFSLGNVEPLASKAHECSITICHEIAKTARQGMEAKALYLDLKFDVGHSRSEYVRYASVHPLMLYARLSDQLYFVVGLDGAYLRHYFGHVGHIRRAEYLFQPLDGGVGGYVEFQSYDVRHVEAYRCGHLLGLAHVDHSVAFEPYRAANEEYGHALGRYVCRA